MKIGKVFKKLLLGIASILFPILLALMFIVLSFDIPTPEEFFIILRVLGILSLVGMFVFYVFHVYRNERIANNQRILWVGILFFGNILAFIAYWYLYIWREPTKPDPA